MTNTQSARDPLTNVMGMVPRYMRVRMEENARLAALPKPPVPSYRFELGRVDKATPELRARILAASNRGTSLGDLRRPLAGLIGALSVMVPTVLALR